MKAGKLYLMTFFAAALALAPPLRAEQPRRVLRLSLDEAVRTALSRNHGLTAASQRTRGSRARVRRAISAFLPSLSFSSTYIRSGGGRTFPMHYHPPGRPFEETVYFDVTFIPEKLHETKFELTQPVFMGGRLVKRLDLARAEEGYYEALEEAARQDLVLEVRGAYMDVLTARENERVMEEALELARENVRAAERLHEAGKAPESSLLRAKVREAEAEQDLLAAKNSIKLALENLAAILDLDLDEDVALEDVPLDEDLDIPALEECTAKALDRSPEVLAARRAYERSSAALAAAKADFAPTLAVRADYGWTEEEYRFKENAWAVYTVLSFDLFKGSDRVAKLSEASARKEEARELLEEARRKAVLRAKQAHFNLQEALGRREVAAARLADAREAYRMISLQYDSQLASQLEVLDAQVSLTAAGVEEVSSRYDCLRARDALLRAMGTIGREAK